jgi:hypothetical protein
MCRLGGSAGARIALAATLCVATALVFGCADANCPNGTVEIGAHCIEQAAAPSTASAGVGASSSANIASNAGNQSAVSGSQSASAPVASGFAGAGENRATLLANGEPCAAGTECAQGLCKNVRDGRGVCCGADSDCCIVPDDCPASYRSPPTCNDAPTCRGTEARAMCIANICSSMMVPANGACDGMDGPTCGLYADVTCMSYTSNQCGTSCTIAAQCDANAFCDRRSCQAKKGAGEECVDTAECMTGSCTNGVCCATGQECCKTAADCKLNLDLSCDHPESCQGTKRSVMCQQSRCAYGERIPDDSACKAPRGCDLYPDQNCTGAPMQPGSPCATTCSDDRGCDAIAMCMIFPSGAGTCVPRGAGVSGNPGSGSAASGEPGGNGNGNGR